MKYLIDTHILLWYIAGNSQLSNKIVEIIDYKNSEIYISNVSLWEITIKSSLNKLDLLISIEEMEYFLNERDILIYPFNFKHLQTLHSLPFLHGDPFDRLIIAQAITDNLIIISDDKQFKNYDVNLF